MPDRPALSGLHHLTLSVSDLDVTLDWYTEVLGFTTEMQAAGPPRKALMSRADAFALSFVEHGAAALPGRFDERRIGLDHVGIGVADRAELDRWIDVLDEHDVHYSPPVRGAWGWVVSFRDPDNIALEFYTHRLDEA